MNIKLKNYTNLIFLFSILLVICFLYQRYKNKLDLENNEDNYNAIQKYLLDDIDLVNKEKKPIIWVLIKYEYNSRNWESFGSRSSFELNQPYLYLTAKSIIKNCDKSFKICFIDDNSFAKLLPNWSIDISKLSNPIKMYIRDLGMTQLLHHYGGMRVPISFLCMRDLKEMYDIGTSDDKVFMCEKVDRNVTSTGRNFFPTIDFMGAQKNNKVIGELIDFMQRTISSDFTSENLFLGEFDRWCEYRIKNNRIRLIDGKLIGTKTMEDTTILVDHLLSNDYIDIYPNAYGIYIPANELMNRTNYNWFLRMSQKQVLESNIIISKYILVASTPDVKPGIIEPMKQKEDWISFWRVPSGAPLWGMKPLNAAPGDNVQRLKYPYN
jgi:hypothetical protein